MMMQFKNSVSALEKAKSESNGDTGSSSTLQEQNDKSIKSLIDSQNLHKKKLSHASITKPV